MIRRPAHPYTKGLLQALPRIDDLDAPLMPVPGDIPGPLDRPGGCVFHTRCGVAISGRCNTQIPQDVTLSPGHAARCHALTKDAT